MTNLRISKFGLALGLALTLFAPIPGFSQVMQKSSCSVPLNERKSAPSIDLLETDGTPIDRDTLIDLIDSGVDTSRFEPQLSDFYTGKRLSPVEPSPDLPTDEEVLKSPLVFGSSIEVDHLTQVRVTAPSRENAAYTLSVTYDVNAAVARNALLRKLGYAIPSPKLYRKLSITFQSLEQRDQFLIKISKIRDMGLWVAGGMNEINEKKLTITLINVALESAILMNIPPMHWGIFKSEVLQSRRPFRALLAPLTLLDIDESVNMYSYEPAKIENNQLLFSRVYASSFRNETTLGDLRWITRKMAQLDRNDWLSIIRAGQYPADIEALILEKTIARRNQLIRLLDLRGLDPLPYNPHLSYGNIINGKAYQARYPGYPHSFSYGDPLNPLRLSEMARYFGIELISNAVKFALDQASRYLQVVSPDQYIKKHSEESMQNLLNHVQNHPNEPYIQPVQAWGGPILGGGVTANRSVVAGTYYGSTSPVQMVDSVSVNARVGAFIGVSGLKNIGLSFTPTLSYNRSYVHLRPIDDLKTAFKDNWLHLAVPFTLSKLSRILKPDEGDDAAKKIEEFLSELKTGEMLIVIDGFTMGNDTMVGIPIGALLGFAPPIANLSETLHLTQQYALLSRTTFYKSEKGLQVYLSDIRQKTHDLTADTQFFLKLFSMSAAKLDGSAETQAFVFPPEIKKEDQDAFQTGMRSLLRLNDASTIREHFKPYILDHGSDGKRFRFKLGPYQWTTRETMNLLEITPPVDPEGSYDATAYKRTVVQGQINKVSGTDFYGFFGSILNSFVSFLNLGGGARGDDPSSNFLGKSKSLIVSTEIETTDTRPNRTLVRLREVYSGWTLKKKKLLKLLRSISDELGDFKPNGGLIDEDSFVQTKRVQAYNVIWNLSIDEDGVKRILDVLNLERYSTRAVTQFFANLMGMKTYEKFCAEQGLKIGFLNGPLSVEMIENSSNSAIETVQGQTTFVTCAPPALQTLFDLRSSLRKHPEVFMSDIHDEDQATQKIHWLNRTLIKLEKNLKLAELIGWAGTDHAYFQLSIAGYRKGDERAQDEEGRSTYFANTIGTVNSTIRSGPLDDIAATSSINSHEISARYLSDGF